MPAVDQSPAVNVAAEILRRGGDTGVALRLRSATERLDGTGAALVLPSRRFHRQQGIFAGRCFDTAGREIPRAEFERRHDEWLPSEADRTYVRSLMARPVREPGHFASWIAPPARGINHQPIDFRYVRYNEA